LIFTDSKIKNHFTFSASHKTKIHPAKKDRLSESYHSPFRNATILSLSWSVRRARLCMWRPIVSHCSAENVVEGGVLWHLLQFSPQSSEPVFDAIFSLVAHPLIAIDTLMARSVQAKIKFFMVIVFIGRSFLELD